MNFLRKASTALLFAFSLTTGGQVMAQDTVQLNKQLLADFGAEVFGNKDFSNLNNYMNEDYIQHNSLVGQGSVGFQNFFGN